MRCIPQADAEALITALDKKAPARVDELNGFIRRHKEQTTKLEQVLRLVENDQVRDPSSSQDS